MRNVEKLVLRHVAMHGKPTVRQAYGGSALRGWKKQMPSCNGVDKVCNMTYAKPFGLRLWKIACPRPTGVLLRDNLENLLR